MLSFTILFSISNLFLIELIFMCPIKTIDNFWRAFFKSTKASISQSSFTKLSGHIFAMLFSIALISSELKECFQNFFIVTMQFIADLVTPYEFVYTPFLLRMLFNTIFVITVGKLSSFRNAFT